MNPIPSAFAIGEVDLPPFLVFTWLCLAAATLTAPLLNRFPLPRFFLLSAFGAAGADSTLHRRHRYLDHPVVSKLQRYLFTASVVLAAVSAVVVVWLTDFAVRQATGNAPSDYRLVKLVSYAGIIAIGTLMLWKAIQGEWKRAGQPHAHDHEGHAEGGCHACEAIARRQQGPTGWLALAVGAVPCTGALLILLFGMANNLLGPAILMVVAISAGMAVAMSGIGILAILGRRSIDRRLNEERRADFASGARIAAAALVFLIGSGLA